MFIFVYSDFESFFRTYFAHIILLSSDFCFSLLYLYPAGLSEHKKAFPAAQRERFWFVFCFIFFFIYKVRHSGALALRPGPIVWRHKITDAPPAKRRSICSDHIFVARIGVLHQVGQCHAVQVFADHTVQLVPQRIGAAFRHARAGRGTFFQAGNSC